MSSLKKISIGAASYDIIPDAITDSNANYKASCPTISSNTTVEVASNKTTVINSASTDTQYPSAKAVFTAIQNASREGSFASNIGTTNGSAYVPLVSTGGMFSTTYLQNLSIPNNKRMDVISGGTSSTIGYMETAGTISTLVLQNATGTAGKITKFDLGASTEIGDSSEPTSDTTEGQNGLYGNGTVYIPATGESDPSISNYAFKGSIINKAGISNSVMGGYISSISNGSYATIGQIFNSPYSNINEIHSYGTISSITLSKLTSASTIERLSIGTGATIGDSTIPTASETTIGQNGLYGKGNISIAATGSSTPSTSFYAFTGSIINKAGASSSAQGGYIETINNNDYATISKLTNALNGHISTIENSGSIEQMRNTGTIDSLHVDSGRITTIVGQGSTANINFATSLAAPMWGVVTNGKVNPWQEIPNVATLVSLLNEQTGILYKYTGSTTTYNGVTYTSGNFYRYEA